MLVVILVHWLIKPGQEEPFIQRWRSMSVDGHAGLYREILTSLNKADALTQADQKFHTFSIGDPFYSTFINIGMWRDLESFDRAIGKYIPPVEIIERNGRKLQAVELDEFEFKLRERVVLSVVGTRGGDLPAADVI